jgi:RNA polymerase sigma factor (TIGR02999 family)
MDEERNPGEITLLLDRWRRGDQEAFRELTPLVYPQLRQVALAYLRRDPSADTLQPTALVNELYLKLLQQRSAAWNDRAHFYAFAAKLMRRILTDHARTLKADKRGADALHIPLNDEMPWVNVNGDDVIDVNRALDELEAVDPRKVRLVELHYFLGCTVPEAAALLDVSTATVERDLTMVKSWLYAKLMLPKGSGPESASA